ncbi:MAG: valine--tRNA ligase, partial [Sandaracinaceae bacterium]
SWMFAKETGHPSIHAAPWPTLEELAAAAPAPDDEGSFALAIDALTAINKRKSDEGVSVGRVTEHLVLAAAEPTRARLDPVWSDVAGAARCQEHRLEAKDGLDEGAFEVLEARFAPKAPKP